MGKEIGIRGRFCMNGIYLYVPTWPRVRTLQCFGFIGVYVGFGVCLAFVQFMEFKIEGLGFTRF